jgi:hypothetical protein
VPNYWGVLEFDDDLWCDCDNAASFPDTLSIFLPYLISEKVPIAGVRGLPNLHCITRAFTVSPTVLYGIGIDFSTDWTVDVTGGATFS